MDIKTLGVVGCGLMGSGIAEIFARAGTTVVVHEIDSSAAIAGRARIEASLRRAVSSGRVSGHDAEHALERISVDVDLEALAGADLVIEAASENEEVKVELFRRLDRVVTDCNAILATNTSSVPIMKLGTVTSRPTQVIGMHFFNPVPVLPLVPYLLSAIRMVESGFASAADVDAGMVNGCAHPMGPLHLADLIGNDTVAAIAASMYAEFKESLLAPPPLLMRMVDAGLLGRKTGRGFFDYAG